jgi:hypothetical protein
MSVDDIHVYPTHDKREHITEGTDCPCNPKIEVHGATLVIIHHAWDFREVAEELNAEAEARRRTHAPDNR